MKRATRSNPLPASKDAIESWLDVLVSMLNLPGTQREQVRDELEDHLRSRVDDLLIMGKSEPEANQTAIQELGETAELAKLISSASRTRTPFRRFAMNATFFILAGSIMTAGVSMMMPNTLPSTVSNQRAESTETHALPAASAAEEIDPFDSFKIDVRTATIQDLFKRIDYNTDRPVIVHWDQIETVGFDRDTPIDIDADEITAGLVIAILAERSMNDYADAIAVLEEQGRIEIGTRSQFDRRTRTQVIYDLSKLTSENPSPRSGAARGDSYRTMQQNASMNIADILQSHISPGDWIQNDGDLASVSVLDSSLVVSAPQRIQSEVDQLLNELIEQHEIMRRKTQIQRLEALDRIRAEYEAAKEKYISLSNEIGHLEARIQRIQSRFNEGLLDREQSDELRDELENLSVIGIEQRLELEEHQRRYQNLQSLMIDTEQEQLKSELN